MKKFNLKTYQIISIAIIALVVLLVGIRSMLIKVLPGHIGVVNAEWTSGFVEQDFQPGFHMDVGPLHTWTVFDTTVQTLHLTRNLRRGEEGIGSLEVRSADGATVSLDVSVKYQIKKGQVWRIRKSQGAGQTLQSGYKVRVKDKVRDTFVATLGSIRTEDFYDPTKRLDVSNAMEESLREALDDLQVDLISILIRDVRFEQNFEERIKQKALAEEQIELNLAETQSEDYRGRTRRIETETQAKVVIIAQEQVKDIATLRAENDRKVAAIRADFEKSVAEMRSDADLYQAQRESEGTRLLRESEAQGQSLRSGALAGAGGNNLVALELATKLNLGSLSVSTQAINPLDVEQVLRLLGADQPGGKQR